MIQKLQENACAALKQLMKELGGLFDEKEAVDRNGKLTLDQKDLENPSVKKIFGAFRLQNNAGSKWKQQIRKRMH